MTPWKRWVDTELQRVVARVAESPAPLGEAMRDCLWPGGKRFRPLLCLGAAHAVGGSPRRAVAVAAALELLHTYSLVHDDLPAMDNADRRRGKPSCHRRFGQGSAILVGDALLTLAMDTLSCSRLPRALEMLRVITRACGADGLIGGQVLDLQLLRRPRPATENTLRAIAQRKTAALITASVEAGALAGNASREDIKRLQRYGSGVGLAFQIIDDLHDHDGLAQVMGERQVRSEVERLVAAAMRALDPFGSKADGLRELAARLASSAQP